MTKQEMLESTVLYYSVNPPERRCVSEHNCMYSPDSIHKHTSEGCAIGRLLPRELANEIDTHGCTTIYNIMIQDKLSVVKHKLPGWMLDMWTETDSQEAKEDNFLTRVQNLHDCSKNWTEKGISNAGDTEIDKIITDFGLKLFDYRHLVDKNGKCLID